MLVTRRSDAVDPRRLTSRGVAATPPRAGVKEAAAQEIRLIKSGKFKDLQRNSIKLAVNLMLTNYQFLENVNKCSVLAKGRSFEAYQVGVSAVDALQQALDCGEINHSLRPVVV